MLVSTGPKLSTGSPRTLKIQLEFMKIFNFHKVFLTVTQKDLLFFIPISIRINTMIRISNRHKYCIYRITSFLGVICGLLLNTISFKFIKISCTDSSIPTIVEYSCGTFSDFARVIHVPSISSSKARRIAIPMHSLLRIEQQKVSLFCPFEPRSTCRGPRNHPSPYICNCYNGIVETRLNMNNSFWYSTLSLSLFMSWIRTNHYNSSAPTDQSTFFTNFTNRSPYFHIYDSLS
uniref:Uncharacterized protein n=1 Tax=Spirodela intermedia TaxID=51605 RepID=A0A8S0XJF6_SPIIN